MKSIKRFITIGLVLVSLAGCEGFLDTNPYHVISNEDAISTFSNLENATNGLYAPMRASNYLGATLIISGDVMADNLARSEFKNSSRYVEQFDLTLGASVGYFAGLWSRPYYIINAACRVIKAIENETFDRQGATDEQVNQLMGEALFIRAMCHFDLVRTFAHHYSINDQLVSPGSDGDGGHLGVPIITEHDITNYPSQNTVKEVYGQIIDDLEGSLENIAFDKGRHYASPNAIKALLARVYLYMEDFEKAALYAEQVITTGEYPLAQGMNVTDYWIKEEGEETIFQLLSRPVEDYFPGNESLGSLFNNGVDYPYSDIIVQSDLYDIIDDSDLRKDLYYEDENGEIRVKKYLPMQDASSPFENNIKILRISEMYLISAEANMQLNPSLAQSRFNELRNARGLTNLTLTRDNLQVERRIELACEGHRIFDLARWKRDNIRTNNVESHVNYPNHKYIFPIPASEIQRNENIKQNEGY